MDTDAKPCGCSEYFACPKCLPSAFETYDRGTIPYAVRNDNSGPRSLGPRTEISSGAAIGSPPFSYRDGVPVPRNGGVTIGADVEIMPFASIVRGTERDTTIGDGCKIDAFVHVAHDVILGKRCILAAGTIVGGWCEIGDDAYLGINCAIKPRVRIGAGAKIGMGAVVTKDVPAGAVYVGNPARFLKLRDGFWSDAKP